MRFSIFKISLLSLLLGVSVSCQRTWHARPALQKTTLGVGANVPADALADKLIAPYRAQVSKKMAEVIAIVPVALEKAPVESAVGNFVADLQRHQATLLTGDSVDIGLMTSGGIRTPLRQGNITVGDIFELMPFENELMVITVPGTVVQQLIEYAAQPHIYTLAPKILSTSNVTYQILNHKPQHILVGTDTLDLNRNYTIALSDYLANGGDNLTFIKNQVNSKKAGILLRDAIIKHLRELTAEGKPVEANVEGRVQVLVPEEIIAPEIQPEPKKKQKQKP